MSEKIPDLTINRVENVLNVETLIGSKQDSQFTFNAWKNEYNIWKNNKIVTYGGQQDVEKLLEVYNSL